MKPARRAIDECAECGYAESKHHTFEPITFPGACICEEGAWSPGDGERICNEYDDSDDNTCLNCEHLEGCHQPDDEASA